MILAQMGRGTLWSPLNGVWSRMLGLIIKLLSEYHFLRQRIPIFIYVIYIHYRDLSNGVIDQVIWTFLSFIGLLTCYLIGGLILKIPFSYMLPLRWTYLGILHWCFFFFIFYQLAIRKGWTSLGAFTLTTLACAGGGWLYEVPFFYIESMFITRFSIFYINSQIVCVLLLFYELIRIKIRPNLLIYISGAFFMAFSYYLFVNSTAPLYLIFANWPMRLGLRVPASIFLLSLLSGIRKEDMKNV